MGKGQSESIVAFIANLLPLYQGEEHEGRWCARSLTDGTLILPVVHPDAENADDGWVTVHWQGDPARQSTVLASEMASIAVARYVELHSIPKAKDTRDDFEHLSQHFRFKTGSGLMFEGKDDLIEMLALLDQAKNVLGKEVLLGILRKSIGL